MKIRLSRWLGGWERGGLAARIALVFLGWTSWLLSTQKGVCGDVKSRDTLWRLSGKEEREGETGRPSVRESGLLRGEEKPHE